MAAGKALRFEDRLELNATASSDPEGEVVSYRWDLDNDGQIELGPSPLSKHTAPAALWAGGWVKLEVTDPHASYRLSGTLGAGSHAAPLAPRRSLEILQADRSLPRRDRQPATHLAPACS